MVVSEPLLAYRKFYLYYIIYWIVWGLIQAGILQWYGFSGSMLIWDSLITYALLGIVCIIVGNIFTYYQPASDVIIYWAILAGVATIIFGYADKALLGSLVYDNEPWSDWLDQSMPVRFFIGFLNIIWMMTVVYFWERISSERETKERKNVLEKSVQEAELFKLRQQLHPHFLFNSLNSINALIRNRPVEARRMVQQLSDFLRGTLKQEEKHFITLQEELAYLELYLDIEKVRFGHRLETIMDAEEEALSCLLPPLMLQPLMENAIKFGLYGTTGDATIHLQARRIDHYLVVAITNPFEPDMQTPEGTGFGLKSIRRRLYLLFGRNDLMEINEFDHKFEVIFRIPLAHD